MNILLIIIFPNAYTISGLDSVIRGSTNQQPKPECSYRYRRPIFSKISNVTQAFRCCNYNRNRAEKLPTATQAPAAPESAYPIGKFKCAFLHSLLPFKIAPSTWVPAPNPGTIQVLPLNLSSVSPWMYIHVSNWTDLRSLSEAPGLKMLSPWRHWLGKARSSPMGGRGGSCLQRLHEEGWKMTLFPDIWLIAPSQDTHIAGFLGWRQWNQGFCPSAS